MKELIVATNPAKRRTTAKQRAAARRNIKKAQAARRRGSSTRRRRAPAARRRAPARRSSPRRNPARRRTPVRRGRFGNIINTQLMPALVGGTGAVVNDVVYGFIPGLPDVLKVGPMRHVGKAGSALLMSWLANFFLQKRTADQLGAGALTVVGYNVVKEFVTRFVPGVPMGEYLESDMGYYGAGLDPNMGVYLDPNMGVVPGAGVSDAGQLTTGTPYLGDMGITWPTQFEEETYDSGQEYGY